ncbi:hypothetical protein CPLU01_00582 [Colletotrichum plurivorum]|uniref:Uncharacterized protein n=1 Tax=Colletotrichum plurivorum TaxID=2175906 RepID=A0A8H6U5X0_9PEZI|nr:hypothetical protein CPLU01_00582 [Colletotrichum plurivorum]
MNHDVYTSYGLIMIDDRETDRHGDRSEGASAAPTLVGISSVDLRRSAEKLASCSSGLLVPHFVTHQAPSPSFPFLHRACPLLCAGSIPTIPGGFTVAFSDRTLNQVGRLV